jgi:predicted nucleic acid-binding protein
MRLKKLAVLDACVLVQAPLRDTLLRLAEAPGLYQPLWSVEIVGEMKRALETQIGLAPAKTAYLERELRRHFPDSWVTGFEPLIRKMSNDKKDRHVLAAAVHAGEQTIITFNKRHFPPGSTSRWNVAVVGPSTFLEELYFEASTIVIVKANKVAVFETGLGVDIRLTANCAGLMRSCS